MIVVMLTRYPKDGEEYARLAGLALSDVVIPGSERNLMGIRLTDDDLIVEFPSFDEHPRRAEINDTLTRMLRMTRATKIPWERVGA